ncbi:MAG: IS66 family insertion sequence element accessory protein TnpB, partial [Acidobacteriota bacterium]
SRRHAAGDWRGVRRGDTLADRGGAGVAMFGLGPATKVFVATGAVDMRKGFEGLYGLVRDELGRDPLSGHLFLFANRSRTRLKLLFWDGSGLWVCAKRLEKGRFRWPEKREGEASVGMRQEELAALVAGLDLGLARPRRGWLRIERAS